MLKIKPVVILVLLLIGLAGCSNSKETLQSFAKEVYQIETYVQDSDWENAKKEVYKLRKRYDDEFWKMQLLGEEAKYDQLKVEIDQLIAAIEAKDQMQIKLRLATVKSYLSFIF
jgi:outer membrane protein assembly factor BamD (BamD/ComL family)